MLDKLQENKTSDYNSLIEIYLLSKCGSESLKCFKTLEYYMEYFIQSGMPPEKLLNGDTCLECETIVYEWDEKCNNDQRNPPQQYFEFWWKKRKCYDKLSQSQEELKLWTTKEIPMSLQNCINNQNNRDTRTLTRVEESSLDLIQSSSLTSGSNISKSLDLDTIDSAADSGVLGVLELTANEFSEGTNVTTTNHTLDKVGTLNLPTKTLSSSSAIITTLVTTLKSSHTC